MSVCHSLRWFGLPKLRHCALTINMCQLTAAADREPPCDLRRGRGRQMTVIPVSKRSYNYRNRLESQPTKQAIIIITMSPRRLLGFRFIPPTKNGFSLFCYRSKNINHWNFETSLPLYHLDDNFLFSMTYDQHLCAVGRKAIIEVW